jgi:hypothetical protein
MLRRRERAWGEQVSHLSIHIARSISHAHASSAVALYAQHVQLYHECNCKPASTSSHSAHSSSSNTSSTHLRRNILMMCRDNLISIAKESTIGFSEEGGGLTFAFKFFTLAFPLVSVTRRMRNFM